MFLIVVVVGKRRQPLQAVTLETIAFKFRRIKFQVKRGKYLLNCGVSKIDV